MSPEELEEHKRTYRAFVKGVVSVAVAVLLVLIVLAWTFSDSFGMPQVSAEVGPIILAR